MNPYQVTFVEDQFELSKLQGLKSRDTIIVLFLSILAVAYPVAFDQLRPPEVSDQSLKVMVMILFSLTIFLPYSKMGELLNYILGSFGFWLITSLIFISLSSTAYMINDAELVSYLRNKFLLWLNLSCRGWLTMGGVTAFWMIYFKLAELAYAR